jgi:hypothetical protein
MESFMSVLTFGTGQSGSASGDLSIQFRDLLTKLLEGSSS